MASGAPEEQVAVLATVSGRVQGVNFRSFVANHARRLRVGGWCRNLPDGKTIEVYAEGPRVAVERLLDRLLQGPGLAHVDDVTVGAVYPPIQAKSEFLEVMNARAERETHINNAQAYRVKRSNESRADAKRVQLEADAYRRSLEEAQPQG